MLLEFLLITSMTSTKSSTQNMVYKYENNRLQKTSKYTGFHPNIDEVNYDHTYELTYEHRKAIYEKAVELEIPTKMRYRSDDAVKGGSRPEIRSSIEFEMRPWAKKPAAPQRLRVDQENSEHEENEKKLRKLRSFIDKIIYDLPKIEPDRPAKGGIGSGGSH
ncbi:MAG: hypothetical protein HRT45_06690 [Bdellovibrionales bacterium]|nr:hypothetical protein [Bdellovibrionales bacterium]